MDTATETRRSRWNDPPPVKIFTESDLDICKLLASSILARDPWGYHYLPTSYFGPLLERGNQGAGHRVNALRGRPHYTALAEQPHDNYRQLIYQLYRGGADALCEAGHKIRPHSRPTSHELMACIIAASFEIGAREHRLPISIVPNLQLPIHPDWRIFTLQGRSVFIEADTASETINPHANSQATSIREKFDHYLDLIAAKTVKRPLFLFVTTSATRCNSFIETLKLAIDAKDCPHEYAEHFGFTSMAYDRFLNTIPPLSGWAVTREYQRAGHQPFKFI
jgi:hypothetical protein